MRLHYGAIPENQDFNPEAEGWLNVHEPGPIAIQFIAFPVAIILLFIWAVCIFSFQPYYLFSQVAKIDIGFLVIFILFFPLHEFLHALVHPNWGLSSNIIIGLWLSKGLFYAHYEGVMSRNRLLLDLVMPFILLGVLPTIMMVTIPELIPSLFWLSVLGSVYLVLI